MSNFCSNFAAYSVDALRAVTIFCGSRRGKCPISAAGYGHYDIASLALCFDLQKSGKFHEMVTKQCGTKMPIGYVIYVRVYLRVPC